MIERINKTSAANPFRVGLGSWSPFLSLATIVFLSLAAPAAADPGDGVAELRIRDQQVRARLAAVDADLVLDFVDTVGLRASSLGLSVEPATAGALRGRLPDAWATDTAPSLPLLVRIQPPETGALSASGGYTIELHLRQVDLDAGLRLRLFRADPGGAFEDVTTAIGHGGGGTWLRGRGTGASELLIFAETRDAARVVEHKLESLEDLLAGHPELLTGSLYGELFSVLGAARNAWQRGSSREAIEHVEDFLAVVSAERGTSIPDTWRSRRDLVDLAAEAISVAESLRFSLILARPQV